MQARPQSNSKRTQFHFRPMWLCERGNREKAWQLKRKQGEDGRRLHGAISHPETCGTVKHIYGRCCGAKSLQLQGHGQEVSSAGLLCCVRPTAGHKLSSAVECPRTHKRHHLFNFHRPAKQRAVSCEVQTKEGNTQFPSGQVHRLTICVAKCLVAGTSNDVNSVWILNLTAIQHNLNPGLV